MNRQIILNQDVLSAHNASEQEKLKLFDQCAQVMSAVADATRLMIVVALRDGPASVSEIAEKIGSDASNTSHHLRILKRAGLVNCKRDGKQQIHTLREGFALPAAGDLPARLDLGCCHIALPNQ